MRTTRDGRGAVQDLGKLIDLAEPGGHSVVVRLRQGDRLTAEVQVTAGAFSGVVEFAVGDQDLVDWDAALDRYATGFEAVSWPAGLAPVLVIRPREAGGLQVVVVDKAASLVVAVRVNHDWIDRHRKLLSEVHRALSGN